MFCPECKTKRTDVVESRRSAGYVLRRRECANCDSRFSTYEIAVVDGFLQVPVLRSMGDGKRRRATGIAAGEVTP